MCSIETLPMGCASSPSGLTPVRSAALGIWIGGGSPGGETAAESGAAHFIEHMLFKGTQSRSAQDIARETDAIGGQMNAFTTASAPASMPGAGRAPGPGHGHPL